jgi:HlyD family secretion protein
VSDHPRTLAPTARPRLGWLIAAGIAVILLFFGGLGSWAALAPLASAAIAPGTVMVDSNRKTVQHLDGGIIAELLVRNGDRVRAGQVLLRLQDVESRAAYDLLKGQRLALLARQARLVAERDRGAEMAVPAELEQASLDLQAQEILDGQRRILASRNQVLAGQSAVLEQRIRQYEAEIASLEAQAASGKLQLQLIGEERQAIAQLVRKGLEKKSRLLALEREAARLNGMQGDYQGRVTRAQQGIAETRMEMLSLQQQRDAETVAELREVEDELAKLSEEMRMAEARLGRTEIAAPLDGLVLNLRYFTTGGVIEPGAPILDLVPEGENLVVEAQLDPSNIDEVRAGLAAQVRLTAFKQRTTPTLPAVVTQVSADALTDQRTGKSYYTARVSIASSDLARLRGVSLYPGMQVEVMIATGERTALDYLMSPVSESFAHAFREQ